MTSLLNWLFRLGNASSADAAQLDDDDDEEDEEEEDEWGVHSLS